MKSTDAIRPKQHFAPELKLALDMIDAPVVFVSLSTLRIVAANRSALPIIQAAGPLVDLSLADLFSDQRPIQSALAVVRDGQQEFATVEVRWADHIDESRSRVMVKLSCVDDKLVIVMAPACTVVEIDALEKDALTGLYSRRAVDRRLAQLISRQAANWGLLFLDLDNYKTVNDELGHVIGDLVLAAFARELAKHARPCDLIARYGGDEFLVLVDNVNSPADLERVRERIAAEVRVQVDEAEPPIIVTASIGAVLAWPELLDPSEIIDAADKAMYASKRVALGTLPSPDGLVVPRN